MHKLGLKLWSTNTESYLREAQRLYSLGIYDYIELYVVPNTLDTLENWKKLNIPYVLHAPHFAHGVNLANSEKFECEEDDNRLVLVQLLHHDSLEVVLLDASWDCLNKGNESVHDFTLLGVFAHHVLHKA